MKIFLLNAPPRAGKDTAANYLADYTGGKVVKFAEPLKAAAAAIYFGGDRVAFDKYDSAELKDTPQAVFFGSTCRQVQIALSENLLKPLHGQTVFGEILAQTIKREAAKGVEFFFVSDSGFKPEAEVLIREFGAEQVTLIRAHRDGCTFQGDSREYINLDDRFVNSFDVENPSGSVDVFYERIVEIVNNLIGVDR
jgi:hypothetical protein